MMFCYSQLLAAGCPSLTSLPIIYTITDIKENLIPHQYSADCIFGQFLKS